MIALELYRIAGLALNSDRTTPISDFPRLVAARTYYYERHPSERDNLLAQLWIGHRPSAIRRGHNPPATDIP